MYTSTTAQPPMDHEICSCIGYIAAAVAIVVWGSMFIFVKNPKVEAAQADPLVSQVYSVLGVLTSSAFLLIEVPYKFSWWATLAAGLWVFSNLLAFPIVRMVGIASGQGIWSGVIAVVSFIWAVVGQQLWTVESDQCRLQNPIYAFGGITLIVAGMIGLTYCSVFGSAGVPSSFKDNLRVNSRARASENGVQNFLDVNRTKKHVEFDPLLTPTSPNSKRRSNVYEDADDDLIANATGNETKSLLQKEQDKGSGRSKRGRTVMGLGLAVIMGILGGSVLVPMKLSYQHGDFENGTLHGALTFALSFAVSGAAIVLAMFVLRVVMCGCAVPKMHFGVVGLPCFLQGALWNVGFAGSTIAVTSPLGMSVGYPLTQCSVLVGALWGVLYYKEIRGVKYLIVFALSMSVLVSGAVILGMGGECKQ